MVDLNKLAKKTLEKLFWTVLKRTEKELKE